MRPTLRRTFFLFLLLITIFYASAQVGIIKQFRAIPFQHKDVSLDERFHSYQTFHLPSSAMAQYLQGKETTQLRLSIHPDLNWDLELSPSNLTSSNFTLQLHTTEGVKSIVSKPNYLFKGHPLRGAGDVRLAIKEGFIYGFIESDDKTYYIEPLKGLSLSITEDQYIIYETSDMISTPLACGVNTKDLISTAGADPENYSILSPQDITCYKLKFVTSADYSIYQKFGGDIEAVEAAVLSNLNMAQSAFTTLNLGTDGSTDLGTDLLHFEVEQLHISTCQGCDFTNGSNVLTEYRSGLGNWIEKNMVSTGAKIFQHYTTRNLFLSDGGSIIGYAHPIADECNFGLQILRYHTDHAASLRVLVAHETGHNLWAQHDNEVTAGVNKYIMYSSAGPGNTAFSTLKDFGGKQYSSHLSMRNQIKSNEPCYNTCAPSTCDDVTDLKVTKYTKGDSLTFSWAGSGIFQVKYKESKAATYGAENIRSVDGNSITLYGINPCIPYSFGVQRDCGSANLGRLKSMDVVDSTSFYTTMAVHERGKVYDLQVDLFCKGCNLDDYEFVLDNKTHTYKQSSSNRGILPNLFADGARHKIVLRKKDMSGDCSILQYYKAPYYRSNSSVLLQEDFSSCTFPVTWKDSLVAKANPAIPSNTWYVEPFTYINSRLPVGTLDSTCMLYLSNLKGGTSGARSLTSPPVDLSNYEDAFLSFDYNLLANIAPNNPMDTLGFLEVEVFDGRNWIRVFKQGGFDLFTVRRNMWDSIPPRVFIPLDSFRHEAFQVRFTVNEGSLIYNRGVFTAVAIDNIRMDGYRKTIGSDEVTSFVVFPNPTSKDWFVKFERQPSTAINYILRDILGRVVRQGLLTDHNIPGEGLSSGVYLLQLYANGKSMGVKKLVKQ